MIATPKQADILIRFERDLTYRKVHFDAGQEEKVWNLLHDMRKCEGCDHIKIDGDRYCWNCGADSWDILGKILDYDLEWVKPVEKKIRSSAEEASLARIFMKGAFGKGHGISCRIARGSSHISVDIPNDHEWGEPKADECVRRIEQRPLSPWEDCPYCKRRKEACMHLEALLSKLIPGTGYHKYSPYDDYAFFTWMVY